ncbi:MAG: hypothetical protein HY898_36115 [Deltaproteobacteria bacterium]|nr:hypothetical protein [Deltaproteobacteria bacterium]
MPGLVIRTPNACGSIVLVALAHALTACAPQAASAPAPPPAVTLSIPSATPAASPGAGPDAAATIELDESCRATIDKLAQSRPARVELTPQCIPGLALLPDLGFITRFRVFELGPSDTPADLSPLARASALTTLEAYTARSPSLESLKALPLLHEVRLSCMAGSLDAVRGLPHVNTVVMERAVVSGSGHLDVSALSTLPSLTVFTTTREVDLADIAAGAPNLEALHARNATATDALGRLQKLEGLTIGCFETSPGFTAPASLRWLRVDCPDLPPSIWRAFPRVESLDVSETELTTLRGVEKMTSLKAIDAHSTKIKSLLPLASVRTLESIDLHGSEVTDLSPLARLPRLKSIEAAPAPVRSIAALAASQSLQSLWLAGAPVSDVRPLAAIQSLKEVMLPRGCDRADAIALHRARPDLKLMAWTNGSAARDPSCYP